MIIKAAASSTFILQMNEFNMRNINILMVKYFSGVSMKLFCSKISLTINLSVDGHLYTGLLCM